MSSITETVAMDARHVTCSRHLLKSVLLVTFISALFCSQPCDANSMWVHPTSYIQVCVFLCLVITVLSLKRYRAIGCIVNSSSTPFHRSVVCSDLFTDYGVPIICHLSFFPSIQLEFCLPLLRHWRHYRYKCSHGWPEQLVIANSQTMA